MKEKDKDLKFLHRDLTWIEFNKRVLYYANDKKTPLNERLKFLSITCSNLDEFIGVRYAGAIRENDPATKDILKGIKNFLSLQFETYKVLKEELNKKKVEITKIVNLDKREKKEIEDIFSAEIFPILSPINIGAINELPNFYSGQNCIALILNTRDRENFIVIPIPKNISNIYRLENKVLMVEDVITYNLKNLFKDKEIKDMTYFRVIKDNSVILDHNQNILFLDRMKHTLEKRDNAPPIFLEMSKDTSDELKTILISALNVDKDNVYDKANILDYTRFMKNKLCGPEESYREFKPYIFDNRGYSNIYEAIEDNDVLLQHPYDSYDPVIEFVEMAADDPDVLAIKQTLYRVSSEESAIVNGLCRAAERGKNVTALIEVKARFDENQNIHLIEKMRKYGVNILLGVEELKTHCKMCLVIKKKKKKTLVYSHVGTGNYNESTSTQYTDISYFTTKQKIGYDLLHIFNILAGMILPDDKLDKVFYSPITLRKRLVKCIDREIEYSKKGKKASMFIKVNSISDVPMVKKLYEAADKGVQIYIICRGITSIVPRKNIYIKSIVGRFLEHSRIYAFRNNGDPEYYISSADLLTRNLDRRIETLISITDSQSIKKLKFMISVLKRDEKNSFKMEDDGKHYHVKGDFDAHEFFMKAAESEKKLKIPKKKK